MGTELTGYGWAPARAALAGNPSDGYGGAVLAVALPGFSAEVWARPADRLEVTPPSALVEATARRFARELEPRALGSGMRWESSIPRDVGLAGSSAVVIATLRALSELWEVSLDHASLAGLALAVEVHELGIMAGPQDRVAQAYGGLTFMDFSGAGRYEPLDPELLPPLLIAWRAEAGGPSGQIHSALRERYLAREPAVIEAMGRLAAEAHRARSALLSEDPGGFGASMDATLELRGTIVELDPRCRDMVEVARQFGASANYTGSGGAIVAACPDGETLQALGDALRDIGCQTSDGLFRHPVTLG